MRKKVVMMALMCLVTLSGKAQTFGNDQVVVSPFGNLYDDSVAEADAQVVAVSIATLVLVADEHLLTVIPDRNVYPGISE